MSVFVASIDDITSTIATSSSHVTISIATTTIVVASTSTTTTSTTTTIIIFVIRVIVATIAVIIGITTTIAIIVGIVITTNIVVSLKLLLQLLLQMFFVILCWLYFITFMDLYVCGYKGGIAKMCDKHDEFISSCNATPIGSPPIGSKNAFNLDMEAIWQLLIPQLQANQKLLNPFPLHL
jgi:hypothetical protein